MLWLNNDYILYTLSLTALKIGLQPENVTKYMHFLLVARPQ